MGNIESQSHQYKTEFIIHQVLMKYDSNIIDQLGSREVKKREIVGKNFEKIMDHKKVNTEFDTMG